MKETMWVLILALLFSTALCIRDIGGGWQGTFKIGGQDLRVMVKVERGDDGGWTAALSIDQSPDRCASILAALFSLQSSDLNFARVESGPSSKIFPVSPPFGLSPHYRYWRRGYRLTWLTGNQW